MYTNEQINRACNEAARRIESNPASYRFTNGCRPGLTPGGCCVLAHIGDALGYENDNPHFYWHDVARRALHFSMTVEFYARMDALLGGPEWRRCSGDPVLTARGLRLYARHYHPVPPPNWREFLSLSPGESCVHA